MKSYLLLLQLLFNYCKNSRTY